MGILHAGRSFHLLFLLPAEAASLWFGKRGHLPILFTGRQGEPRLHNGCAGLAALTDLAQKMKHSIMPKIPPVSSLILIARMRIGCVPAPGLEGEFIMKFL